MRGIVRSLGIGLAILMTLLLLAPAAAWQGTPAPGAEPPVGVLAEADIPVLPSPDAEVWLVRYELAPGGTLPSQAMIGPTLALVESGELTLASDQPLERLDDPASTGSGEMVLAADAAVSVPDGATLEARNDGDAPVVFLMLMAFTPEREMAAMAAESTGDPVGLTVLGLAVTHGAFPEGPGQIRIGRRSAPAGATVPYQAQDTAVTMLVEQGGGTLTVADGVCGVFPPMETNSDVIMVGPGHPQGVDSAELTAGSGLGCGGADATVQVGSAGMTVLFAEVTPAEE